MIMRALLCETLSGIDGLRVVTDAPEPVPEPGQACVAMAAAALNFPDLLMLEGRYQHRAEPPYVPGLEGAGVVEAVGDGVDPSLVGRRVIVGARGTLAERVVVHADTLTELPTGWSFEAGAGFRVVAVTAYNALVHRAALRRGETLLVNGASGGTGHMAVMMGRALGARVIATGGDAGKLDVVKELGADAVVQTSPIDTLSDRIKAANAGRGVDVVFDPVGGPVLDASIKATSYGARIAIIGFASGSPNAVRTNYALIKCLSILGVRAGEAARHDPRIAADYRTALPALAEAHDLKPRIAQTFALADARAAFEQLAARTPVGKIVIDLRR